MAPDGVSKSEIARRLGINRRTAARLVEAKEPPRYSRVPAGSMLDPLEPVMRRLIEDWPAIKAPRVTEILRDDYGYCGSVDLVRKRLALCVRGPSAQRSGRAIGRGRGAGRLGRDADAAEDRRTRAACLHLDLFVAVLRGGDRAFHLRHDDRVVLGRARPRVRLARGRSARVRL